MYAIKPRPDKGCTTREMRLCLRCGVATASIHLVDLWILILLTLLAGLIASKIVILVQALLWVWKRGEAYAERVFQLGPLEKQEPADIGRIMLESGGDIFPLGVYPLTFWKLAIVPLIIDYRGSAWIRVQLILRVLVSLWLIVPLSAVVLTLTAGFPIESKRYESVIPTVGYICAVLLLLLMLVSAIGTFTGNVVFGELNLLQVGLPGLYVSVTRSAQGQMAAFMGSALFSWIAATAAITYTSARAGGFERFALLTSGGARESTVRFLEAGYFVALAALGVTEIDATRAASKVLVLLLLLLGLSLIAFLLGLLVGVVGDASRAGSRAQARSIDEHHYCSGGSSLDAHGNSKPAIGRSARVTDEQYSTRSSLLGVLIVIAAILAAVLRSCRVSARRRY